MPSFLLALLFAASLHAQPAPQLIWVNIPGSSPTTVKCQGTQYLGWNVTSTSTFYCSAAGADWAPQSSSGGGPPTGAAGGVLSCTYPDPCINAVTARATLSSPTGTNLAGNPAIAATLLTALSTPTAPVVTPTCTGTCATSYGYEAVDWYLGFESPNSTPTTVSNAVSLDSGHYNTISHTCQAGASFWTVQRSISAGALGWIGGANTVNDGPGGIEISCSAGTLVDNGLIAQDAGVAGINQGQYLSSLVLPDLGDVATPTLYLGTPQYLGGIYGSYIGNGTLAIGYRGTTVNKYQGFGFLFDADDVGGTGYLQAGFVLAVTETGTTVGGEIVGTDTNVVNTSATNPAALAIGNLSEIGDAINHGGGYTLAIAYQGDTNVGGLTEFRAFYAPDSNGETTTGYGFRTDQTAGSGQFGFYAAGDAVNYFGGPVTAAALGNSASVCTTSGGALTTSGCSSGPVGTPKCVSNTGSASSTAYSCSDGGSSSIAAGYQTVWQPGTNDTANTTGTPTLAVDGASAATIVRVVDGVSIPLGFPTVGKTFAGVQFLVTWNGTHWQVDGLGQAGPYASSNTTVGVGSLLGTGATDNTCIGGLACSMAGDVSNGDNTAVGYEALDAVTSGASNTVIGSKAGTGMVTGSNNFFGGYEACNASTGGNNVCIGYEAASGAINHALTSGSNNVIIGDQTDLNGSGSFSNSICIGHEAICQASNTVTLGDSAVTTGYVGAIPIQLQVATGTIAITASATALTCTTGTTTATNATTGMVVVISAAGTPDLKTVAPQAYVSSAGNITVNVCTLCYGWRRHRRSQLTIGGYYSNENLSLVSFRGLTPRRADHAPGESLLDRQHFNRERVQRPAGRIRQRAIHSAEYRSCDGN